MEETLSAAEDWSLHKGFENKDPTPPRANGSLVVVAVTASFYCPRKMPQGNSILVTFKAMELMECIIL
jgi:hypothetical protein